jgi:hypothetical protein
MLSFGMHGNIELSSHVSLLNSVREIPRAAFPLYTPIRQTP